MKIVIDIEKVLVLISTAQPDPSFERVCAKHPTRGYFEFEEDDKTLFVFFRPSVKFLIDELLKLLQTTKFEVATLSSRSQEFKNSILDQIDPSHKIFTGHVTSLTEL